MNHLMNLVNLYFHFDRGMRGKFQVKENPGDG